MEVKIREARSFSERCYGAIKVRKLAYVSSGKVATLKHEAGDDTMEG